MKILIVASGNRTNVSSFILEQARDLAELNNSIDFFLVNGKGILGYLKNRRKLIQHIRQSKPDIIHAHYGLSGLLSNLQRSVPVITTYHGSDINNTIPRLLTKFAIYSSTYNIFVSQKLANKARIKNTFDIIACGINLNTFKEIDTDIAKRKIGLPHDAVNILFSSRFTNKVKNYPLAKEAINRLKEKGINANLIELYGYSRDEVNILMNAVDCILVTSFKESGPLVVKEALAINKPVVTVDVGDVKEIIGNTEGCFICSYDPNDIAEKLKEAVLFKGEPHGRERIIELGLTSEKVALKINDIYKRIIERN